MSEPCVRGHQWCPGPDATLSDPPRCTECIAKAGEQRPSKERIGFLIDYWTAKSQSHQRRPEGQGMQAELIGLIYEHTIAALRHLHSDPEPCEGRWYSADDIDCLVRELDVLLNGEHRAARQAKLCDIVAQFKRERWSLWKGDNPSHAQPPGDVG